MDSFTEKENYCYADLLNIMQILRKECMWDKEQTHKSIRRNFIEETYEAVEAIDDENTELLKEELGDVLLQVVFHAEIEREKGSFDMEDVCDGICKKLIYRHPHIFKDTVVHSTEEVLSNWDALKKTEKKQKSVSDGLYSVAKSLPGLIRAEKVQAKAAKAGFDWENVSGAMQKIEEETKELQEAITKGDRIEEEMGDLLFSVVNVSRFVQVDSEQAIEKATEKFIRRFEGVEQAVRRQGKELMDLSLAELDAIWEMTKEWDKR